MTADRWRIEFSITVTEEYRTTVSRADMEDYPVLLNAIDSGVPLAAIASSFGRYDSSWAIDEGQFFEACSQFEDLCDAEKNGSAQMESTEDIDSLRASTFEEIQ